MELGLHERLSFVPNLFEKQITVRWKFINVEKFVFVTEDKNVSSKGMVNNSSYVKNIFQFRYSAEYAVAKILNSKNVYVPCCLYIVRHACWQCRQNEKLKFFICSEKKIIINKLKKCHVFENLHESVGNKLCSVKIDLEIRSHEIFYQKS